MARGWESKSVEAQMEAAEDRASLANRTALAAEEVRAQRERESLELSRTRVLQDIAAAVNPRYREVLERSLGFLDDKLKALAASKG
jgi:molecular chaperone GrpE (heat shock protein)